MFDTIIHRLLKRPYRLHICHDIRPKKYRATVVLLHGIGNTGGLWADIVRQLPADVRVITVDLLGFGASPKPRWAVYNAHTQARSVTATLKRLRIRKPLVLVGYSLGGLVAVELVTKFGLTPKHLILLSPPFYKPSEARRRLVPSEEKVLRDIYRAIRRRPDQFYRVSQLAARYSLVNKEYIVGEDGLEAYMDSLEASIINQTSYGDALNIKQPTTIVYGKLDPVVVHRNLKDLAAKNPHITLKSIVAGHVIIGKTYPAAIVKEITAVLPKPKRRTNKV